MAVPQMRFAFLLLAAMQILLISGQVYGWPSLRALFENSGLLDSFCSDGADCDTSKVQFNRAFTVGSWSAQGMRFFTGIFLDRYGPAATSCACALALSLGYGLFALAESHALGAEGHLLAAGMFFVGVGSGAQLAVQSVGQLFPSCNSTVQGILAGANTAGVLPWLVMQHAHRSLRATAISLFLGYACFAFVWSAGALLTWPRQPFKAPPAQEHSLDEVHRGSPGARRGSGVAPWISKDYVLLVAWFSLQLLGSQFYIGSFADQMRFRTAEPSQIASLVDFCSAVLAVSGVVAPLVGFAIDCCGFGPMLTAMTLGAIFVNGMLLFQNLLLQYVCLVVFAVQRVSLFVIFFSRMVNLSGGRDFGKMAGLGLVLSGTVSLAQAGLFALSLATSFTLVNVVLICSSICVLPFPIILWLDERRAARAADPSGCHRSSSGARTGVCA